MCFKELSDLYKSVYMYEMFICHYNKKKEFLQEKEKKVLSNIKQIDVEELLYMLCTINSSSYILEH